MSEENGFFSKIAGVTFDNDDGSSRQEVIKDCKEGDRLNLIPTPSEYDDRGIKVVNRRTQDTLGWLKKEVAHDIWEWTVEQENDYYAQISEITGTDDPNKTLGCNIYLKKIKVDRLKQREKSKDEEIAELKEQINRKNKAENLQNLGQGMRSLGCLLTIFVTIPILIFIFFL
jgi:hypothetical protein